MPNELIKVAFCITDLDPGGAERALVRLVTKLDRSEWDPHVFCLADYGSLVDDLALANVPVTCLGVRRKTQFGVVYRLCRILRNLRPQILQTYLYHANIVGRVAGTLARVPTIVSGIRVAEKRSRWPLFVDRATNWMVDENVCVSDAVRDYAVNESGLSQEKTTVIPNGIEASLFENANPADLAPFGIPPNNRTILFVGRLDSQKAPLDLLNAVPELLDSYDDLHILFVGTGPLEADINNWIADRQLESRIHLAGWQADVAGLMKSTYCLALPSLWEGMPNVVLEAMAAGLPVVATTVEGIGELLSHQETGMVVPVGSQQKMGAALRWLLDHPEDSLSMASSAQELIHNRFTSQQIADSYTQLYRELLSRPA